MVTRLARRPALYWSVAALLATLTAGTVYQLVSTAEELKAAYGESVEVLVTTDPVARGQRLAPAVERRAVPVALVPVDAVDEVPGAAVAGRAISKGAVLTDQDVNRGEDLGADQAAIAVPLGPTTPSLSPGQHVLIVVNADPFVGLEPAQLPATVHAIDSERATLAGARSDLNVLSAALQSGSITIAST
ncbi:MAG: SAF domain-containing protein [Acidimicrobiales bacterium]